MELNIQFATPETIAELLAAGVTLDEETLATEPVSFEQWLAVVQSEDETFTIDGSEYVLIGSVSYVSDGGSTVELESEIIHVLDAFDVRVSDTGGDVVGVMVNGKLQDFHSGDTLIFRYAIKLNGTPVDLSADTVTFCLKQSYGRDELIHVDADVDTDGVAGIAIVTVTSEQTASLAPGNYVYEVYWERADGFSKTLQVEAIKVLRRVHNASA